MGLAHRLDGVDRVVDVLEPRARVALDEHAQGSALQTHLDALGDGEHVLVDPVAHDHAERVGP